MTYRQGETYTDKIPQKPTTIQPVSSKGNPGLPPEDYYSHVMSNRSSFSRECNSTILCTLQSAKVLYVLYYCALSVFDKYLT